MINKKRITTDDTIMKINILHVRASRRINNGTQNKETQVKKETLRLQLVVKIEFDPNDSDNQIKKLYKKN